MGPKLEEQLANVVIPIKDNVALLAGLDNISREGYLGKIIIAGQDPSGEYNILSYAVSSMRKSRRFERLRVSKTAPLKPLGGDLVPVTEHIRSEPDEEIDETDTQSEIRKIIPELEYSSIQQYKQTMIVASSHHCDDMVRAAIEYYSRSPSVNSPLLILVEALEKQRDENGDLVLSHYDFDTENNKMIARINAVATKDYVALGRIRKDENEVFMEDVYKRPLSKGSGWYISTHTFGEPQQLLMLGRTPEETCERIYKALGPNPYREEDYRVGVATVFHNPHTNEVKKAVYNKDHS